MIGKLTTGTISHEIDRLYDYQFNFSFFGSRHTLSIAMGTDATKMTLQAGSHLI